MDFVPPRFGDVGVPGADEPAPGGCAGIDVRLDDPGGVGAEEAGNLVEPELVFGGDPADFVGGNSRGVVIDPEMSRTGERAEGLSEGGRGGFKPEIRAEKPGRRQSDERKEEYSRPDR